MRYLKRRKLCAIPGEGDFMLMYHDPEREKDRTVAKYESPEECKAVATYLNGLMCKTGPVSTKGFSFYYVHNVKTYINLPWIQSIADTLLIRHADNQEYGVACGQ